jgi:ubiquinone/menaquinone biosynthesis C-methylase UbiE
LQVDLRKAPHIDFVADIRSMPAEWENAFDVAKSHHVLEHFGFQEIPAVLAEWYRIIKPGGKLQVTLPDLQTASEAIAAGRFDIYMRGVLYGDQGHPFWSQCAYGGYDAEDAEGQPRKEPRFLEHSYQHNHHKSGFTAAYLIELMEAAGFVNVVVERHLDWCELRAQGQKPVFETVEAAVGSVSPAETTAVTIPEAAE